MAEGCSPRFTYAIFEICFSFWCIVYSYCSINLYKSVFCFLSIDFNEYSGAIVRKKPLWCLKHWFCQLQPALTGIPQLDRNLMLFTVVFDKSQLLLWVWFRILWLQQLGLKLKRFYVPAYVSEDFRFPFQRLHIWRLYLFKAFHMVPDLTVLHKTAALGESVSVSCWCQGIFCT